MAGQAGAAGADRRGRRDRPLDRDPDLAGWRLDDRCYHPARRRPGVGYRLMLPPTGKQIEARQMTGRPDGKIAIVIGGARGIGAGACEVFVREGAQVVLADIETKQGESVAASFPGRVTFVTADISKRADMQRLAASALERHGRIDILAQVAGIYPNHLIEDLSEEEWDRVLDINLK